MAKKLTQKKVAFYILHTAGKETPGEYVPAWKFVGEIYIKELDEWYLMSYKGPTNGLAIYFDNPTLIDRTLVKGKSGAEYYAYRMRAGVRSSDIRDPILLDFYNTIKS